MDVRLPFATIFGLKVVNQLSKPSYMVTIAMCIKRIMS